MRILKQEQFLPISLEEAWEFFSTPLNLNVITPPDMHFEIISELPKKIHPGLLIHYKIMPVMHIKMNWTTEITEVVEFDHFVDEQRKGPYRYWHHEHHFKSVDGGVMMTDILHYDIGMSFLGWIAGELFVHQRVDDIFDYRFKKLQHYFVK